MFPSQAWGNGISCLGLPAGHSAQGKATVPMTSRVTLLQAQFPSVEWAGTLLPPAGRGWALCTCPAASVTGFFQTTKQNALPRAFSPRNPPSQGRSRLRLWVRAKGKFTESGEFFRKKWAPAGHGLCNPDNSHRPALPA